VVVAVVLLLTAWDEPTDTLERIAQGSEASATNTRYIVEELQKSNRELAELKLSIQRLQAALPRSP
jgi:hypothetical protein